MAAQSMTTAIPAAAPSVPLTAWAATTAAKLHGTTASKPDAGEASKREARRCGIAIAHWHLPAAFSSALQLLELVVAAGAGDVDVATLPDFGASVQTASETTRPITETLPVT